MDGAAGLLLRPLHRSHLPAVAAIEAEGQAHPWRLSVFEDCLRAGYSGWVLLDGDAVIAFAIVSMGVEEAHLLNIGVTPAWRRRGLAQRLLDHLAGFVRAGGARQLLLEVRVSNFVAISLYRRLGFAELARRPGYYPAGEQREDALIMSLPLD